jgi:molybdate transport system regulatory protein
MTARRNTPELVLRLKLGDGILGPGKIELLERIERLGSITAAACDMGMSYRQAWLLLATMNQKFREPLVATSQGGRRGGGTLLTATGRKVVDCYRTLVSRVERLVARELRAIAAMTHETAVPEGNPKPARGAGSNRSPRRPRGGRTRRS